jgi:carbon storage regulator
MIVLSRKKNESIVISDNIVVTIVEIRGDKVRLGIEHPMEIPVHRQEIYDAIQREAARSPLAPAQPTIPIPHFPPPPPDKVDRLASALQARLAVPVRREQVLQSLSEAGIELPGHAFSAPR